MEQYIVSACLAGINCRYNCSNKNSSIVNNLIKEGKAIPLCPEQLAGLPTPREPVECKMINGKIKVVSKSGIDYTDYLYRGAQEVLEFAKRYNIHKAILQNNSPSCGLKTYDGTFTGTIGNYSGITAKILMDNNIEVIAAENLGNI